MPPLGALSLAGTLEQRGYKWTLADTQMDPQAHPFAVDHLVKMLQNAPDGTIGLSIFNDAIPLVICALDRLGPQQSKAIVIGGPGVVGVARPLVERLKNVHAVVVGEGETALLHLATLAPAEWPSTGVFWRNSTDEVVGTGRTPRENLRTLPAPAWTWCKGRGYETVPLSTMRGCPFSCSFCEIIAFMGRRVTRADVAISIESLRRALDAVGSNAVSIVDDTFTTSPRHISDLCQAIQSADLGVRFSIFSRTDTLSESQMELLAASGCQRVFFGIDSGDDEILRATGKGIEIESALQTVRKAAEFFSVTASFIWGYPFESVAGFHATLDTCKRLLDHGSRFPITPQLHLLSPSAGTPLFQSYASTLVLDTDADSLLAPGGISSWSDGDGFEEALSVIREDPLLCAPFYRYETEGFDTKRTLAAKLDDEILCNVGDRVISALITAGRRNV